MKNLPRSRSTRAGKLLLLVVCWVIFCLPTRAAAQPPAASQPLQLAISIEESSLTEPFPARINLHFHNAGSHPLWLYTPLRDASEVNFTSGGSSLAVHLEPVAPSTPGKGAFTPATPAPSAPPTGTSAPPSGAGSPAIGTLLLSAGFPHPKLVKIAPGGDYEETAVIHITPAMLQTPNGAQPVWGNYSLSVAYSAAFSNANSINQNLGVVIWQGTLDSNSVQLVLSRPAATSSGSVSGTVLDHDMRQAAGILVSLSDWNEHPIAQIVTGNDGGFSFTNLPYGRYWVTVRRLGSAEDRSFFEHADLTASQPEARLKLILLNEEIYEEKQLQHKPVLFRITTSAGNPVENATLEVLWSSGTVINHLKQKLDSDGLAVLNLIPGTNYVTIVKHGCPKEDRTADVAPGGGIDGFSFTLECQR